MERAAGRPLLLRYDVLLAIIALKTFLAYAVVNINHGLAFAVPSLNSYFRARVTRRPKI